MSRLMLAFILVWFVAFLGSAAQAVLISFDSDAEDFSWSPSGAIITLDITSLAGVDINITAEAKSTFTITTTTTNESGFTWTGYILSLDKQGAATFVEGTAGSTKFQTVKYPDPWSIEFWAPEEVLPGQVVTLRFDINIPDIGPMTFTLAQQPIPEPTTIAILGLGSLFLLRKRKGM